MSNLQTIVEESVKKLLDNTISEKKLKVIKARHDQKVHFIPYKYRILGGLLQSLNIQFGNFIENLIPHIASMDIDPNLRFLDESGKKNIKLSINHSTDRLINEYMTKRQINLSFKTFDQEFQSLLQAIFDSEKANNIKDNIIRHDLDMIFQDKKDGKIYYIESKYTDDHDTGKFIDINSKFLKTYAGLINYLEIEKAEDLHPYIFYFNKIIKKANYFVCEDTHILRGAEFFDKFLTCKYEELENVLSNISESKFIVATFDDLYQKIRYSDK
jgi:hypothetical protein